MLRGTGKGGVRWSVNGVRLGWVGHGSGCGKDEEMEVVAAFLSSTHRHRAPYRTCCSHQTNSFKVKTTVR